MTNTERKTLQVLRDGAATFQAAEQAIERLKAERDVARKHIGEMHEYAEGCSERAERAVEQMKIFYQENEGLRSENENLKASVDALRTKFLADVQSMRNMAKFFVVDLHQTLES